MYVASFIVEDLIANQSFSKDSFFWWRLNIKKEEFVVRFVMTKDLNR